MAKASTPSPGRRFTDRFGPAETIIAEGTLIQAELYSDSSVEVHGRVEGSLRLEGLLWIHPGGSVEGDVEAGGLVIQGEVRGKIVSTGKVELGPTAQIYGDVVAGSVAMAEGSFFVGHIRMQARKQGGGGNMAFTEKRGQTS